MRSALPCVIIDLGAHGTHPPRGPTRAPGLVVSSGDGAEVLEATECAFDHVAQLVTLGVEGG